ncbi:MAG: phosphate ABC transporter permease PstA [Chloroflexi bacterium]|nr:phosphate ABC transporter permease PstA [Chloroflexota bacterium]
MQRTSQFNQRLQLRKAVGTVLYFVFLAAVLVGIVGLLVLLTQILIQGVPWLSWHFISGFPSRHAEEAGLLSALAGTIWLMILTAAFTVPLGVGAAIYLEEYAPRNWVTNLIEINLSNLAGVPSIVYGMLGLAVFVQFLSLGRTLLAGAMTLALLVLPIVILASREAIRAVPDSHRQAAFALGADKWQVIRGVVLPSSMPGILTGTILAMSRAIGEAAPVLAISALVYLTFVPTSPLDRFTVLPIQIFNWVSRPQDDFRGLAAAAIIVLLVILLTMNSLAILLRDRFQVKADD